MKWTAILVFACIVTPLAAERERLQIVKPGGRIVATIDGERSRVVITSTIDELLGEANAHLTLIHNHPGSVGLSGADLEQLTKRGVDRIVAVGADSSRYEARRGPAFDADAFIAWQYRAAESAVRAFVSRVYREPQEPLDVARSVPHLTAIVLRNIGVLEYEVRLAHAQLEAERRYFFQFSRVVAHATARFAHSGDDGGR
jgi:hypothetical protein